MIGKSAKWILLGIGALIVLGGSTVSNYASYIIQFAQAIANAEGENVSGSVPNRQNNPGDLVLGGKIGTFPTLAAGWEALYHQVSLMFNGTSAHYSPDMSIAEIGYIYADGQHDPQGAANWAANVASTLGVSTDTTLNDLMGVQS